MNIFNVPEFEAGWFIHYATFMGIGYSYYIVDCDEHFPISYDLDFKKYCKKVYDLLNMEVQFFFDYDSIYESDRVVKDAYQLVLQYNETQYQLSFKDDMGCRNADLFMAINNRLLKDSKISYRFLKLDEANYVITNEESLSTIVKLYKKYWF